MYWVKARLWPFTESCDHRDHRDRDQHLDEREAVVAARPAERTRPHFSPIDVRPAGLEVATAFHFSTAVVSQPATQADLTPALVTDVRHSPAQLPRPSSRYRRSAAVVLAPR